MTPPGGRRVAPAALVLVATFGLGALLGACGMRQDATDPADVGGSSADRSWTGTAAPTGAGTAPADAVPDNEVSQVESAVTEAEQVVGSIEAELAQDGS